jgi:tryptophan synthase alpha chain
MLKSYIKKKLETKDILLMTHIVMGYPSFEDSMNIVEQMVESGVDLMELQIPFSEPMADGPVILKANQKSLENGSNVTKCFEFAENVAQRFNIPFLFMSYANILYKFGMERFSDKMAAMDIKGSIVPDIPPEEGNDYIRAMKKNELCPIFIFTPQTSDERMTYLADKSQGFIYCVARKGVTGKKTQFSNELETYLKRCRRATDLPLAVGFGVKDKDDVNYLKGKADIAVIGSETIRIVDKKGVKATSEFICSFI